MEQTDLIEVIVAIEDIAQGIRMLEKRLEHIEEVVTKGTPILMEHDLKLFRLEHENGSK